MSEPETVDATDTNPTTPAATPKGVYIHWVDSSSPFQGWGNIAELDTTGWKAMMECHTYGVFLREDDDAVFVSLAAGDKDHDLVLAPLGIPKIAIREMRFV